MIRRALLGLAFLIALAAPALAQETATEPPPARVALDTSAGTIVIALDMKAPITVANFLRYVDEGRLEGAEFYRALDLGAAGGLVQGGSNGDPARVLPPIAHEPTSQTGLSHVEGAVSMARFDAGTATGDFFIVVGPGLRSLDATAGDPGFAVFGRVVQGMEAVRAILASPRSATEGEGVMRGQMLDPGITIRSARRLD